MVDAALAVSEKTDSGFRFDVDDVKVEKKSGGSLRDTKLIKGIVLDKEVVHGHAKEDRKGQDRSHQLCSRD